MKEGKVFFDSKGKYRYDENGYIID